jgi:hypothetical protein
MSEIKVNKVSPATGTAITLGDSGDTFTVPSGATIVNSGTATGFGGGKVLQVVSVIKTDTFVTSATTVTEVTGATASITPASTSNHIIVMMSFCMSPSADATTPYLYRDSTSIGLGDQFGTSRRRGPVGTVKYEVGRTRQVSWVHKDSPSTTSAVAYSLRVQGNGSGQVVNIGRSHSGADQVWDGSGAVNIILMEIGA